MRPQPTISAFNDGVLAEQFERYQQDPASVDESWRQYFRSAEALFGGATAPAASVDRADVAYLRKVAAAAQLMQAIRNYGHLAVRVDPLGSEPSGAIELTPEFHGITDDDLRAIPGTAIDDERFASVSAYEVVARKREVYTNNLGLEVWHIENDDERNWFRAQFRSGHLVRALTVDEKKAIHRRLCEVDGLERFLGRAYTGYKRFSIEGTDALVPILDEIIAESAQAGAREVVVGMAHRGRLNVLTNVMGKPYEALFGEFEGRHKTGGEAGTGDVKYHLGFENQRRLFGRDITLRLVPNPSHLEVVNPVLEGVARAHQRVPGAAPGTRDELSVVPVCIHGDAAFPGEGVVAETFNISALNAFRTGGTIHVIVNNQVGFTTDPNDARSTYYASDLAKGFEVPIFHVNGDDAEACMKAVRLACAYRTRFRKDVLIDLVGYRRHGHNEGDEPTYTQPALYQRIKAHPTVPRAWAKRLVEQEVFTAEEAEAVEQDVMNAYATRHAAFKASIDGAEAHQPWPEEGTPDARPVDTAVQAERLLAINDALLRWPADFNAHPRLAKQLERRRDAVGPEGGIDWGHAEALAFGSLVSEGVSVRLTGQDAERGTFSHRHSVLNDVESGRKYAPLAHLPGASAAFEVYNSALSELAVMGFEYGYSTAAPDTLVLWEAQFGDFVNVAQPIIDQFLIADRAKWGQDSSLVLLLPHGYEGQGPEHSSARLERFLQSAAEGNMSVGYLTTPAQYFHMLRRQALRRPRRPLVLMQPKSMLRLPQAASRLVDLASGGFQPVLDDPVASQRRDDVRRLVFCTGKVYYDMALDEKRNGTVALVRVEELYPWPHEEIQRIVDLYPAIEEVAWVQEEPKNMGAWTYVQPRLRVSAGAALGVRYIGRQERASPAEGYTAAHTVEQARIVSTALAVHDVPAEAMASAPSGS
jgi:2-oxoglutarate dehydrogenase E1 component